MRMRFEDRSNARPGQEEMRPVVLCVCSGAVPLLVATQSITMPLEDKALVHGLSGAVVQAQHLRRRGRTPGICRQSNMNDSAGAFRRRSCQCDPSEGPNVCTMMCVCVFLPRSADKSAVSWVERPAV
jgi:hypothetical protein